MKKYIVTTEFRYSKPPKSNYDSDSVFKKITNGVFDDIDGAINEANNVLNRLSASGKFSFREKFRKIDLFGKPTNLVCDLYESHGVVVFIKIITLDYCDIDTVLNEAFVSQEAYNEWKNGFLDSCKHKKVCK